MSEQTMESGSLRHKRATRSVVAGLAFQATYVLAQFVILAVLFRYVDPESFGMWVTIFGLTMWLSLLPLGMNRSLLTWLGRVAFNQPQMIWCTLSAAVGVALLTSGIAAVALFLLGWHLPWAEILNVTGEQATAEATPTAVWALLVAAVAVPAAMGGMVLQACQYGATRHTLGIAAQVAGVLLLFVGVWNRWPLSALGVVIISPLLLAGLMQWAAVFFILPPRPGKSLHAEKIIGPMLKTSLGLWVIEVALILILNSGPLLVAQAMGSQAVAPYAAVYRLIGPHLVACMVIGQTYWPAFGDASAARDHAWIGFALRRSAVWSLLLWLLGSAVCLTIGRPFVRWWLGPQAEPGYLLIASGLLLALAHGMYHWSMAPLSGLGRLRVQAVAGLCAIVLFAAFIFGFISTLDAVKVFLLQALVVGGIGVANLCYLYRAARKT